MIVSSIAFKVAFTALVVLILIVCMDELNGTGHPQAKSPAWIFVPGALAGLTMIVSFIVAVIAMIWGL